MIDFEKIHKCEKSKGKIVLIEVDNLGNTYCGYCHKKVDYFKALKEPIIKEIEKLQEEEGDYIQYDLRTILERLKQKIKQK